MRENDMYKNTSMDGMKRAYRETPGSRPLQSSRMYLFAIAIAVVLLAGGVTWFAMTRNTAGDLPEEGGEQTRSSKDVVELVGELIVLPEGEEPTVATVRDPKKLQDQPFFKHAKEGDIVLMYTQAQKAYLYDPLAHKLVEVAPITIDPF